jgi:RecB family exonuclease
MRTLRLDLARRANCGTSVMTFEQLAARLAGGFKRPVDGETLRATIREILPNILLGDLEGIKMLPGMAGAAAQTLHKVWRAGLDLQARSGEHPRLKAIADLEAAVLTALPPSMLRPLDLAAHALARIKHAPGIFGSIEIHGLTALSPCWHKLLAELATRLPVKWVAGPREVPRAMLNETAVEILESAPLSPEIACVSAATPLHEAMEAIRWARELVASGRAEPGEIAIAAASTAEYDDYILTLRADANIPIHFAHGTSVMATRDGQAAAALADILTRGLSQTRLRRLASLVKHSTGLLSTLPDGWTRVLPDDAPLSSLQSWQRFLAHLEADAWPDQTDHNGELATAIELLSAGVAQALEIGEKILDGKARILWRKALDNTPPSALAQTLTEMRFDDSLEAPVAITWMPASALAASPRQFVRLLGLTSRAWPRVAFEDPLLPDHLIPSVDLEPLPIGLADDRDFRTILATTNDALVLSRPRRDGEGRLLGKSPLLQRHADPETYLPRNYIPAHAMSEADRLFARPKEFAASPAAIRALSCWRAWQSTSITPHDGLVRGDHPLILHLLEQDQSATSLRKLLRDPLGFVWQYGLRLRAPRVGLEPLMLDNLETGNLLHGVLERCVRHIEAGDGLAAATLPKIEQGIQEALDEIVVEWEAERGVPPSSIWRKTLADIKALTQAVIVNEDARLPGQRSFTEVPFGQANATELGQWPWDPSAKVVIPGAGFRITGRIDRLDISGDATMARVRDYKTGKAPKEDFILAEGRELQRCLYAFAIEQLLGERVSVEASLNYVRHGKTIKMADPAQALLDLSAYLTASRGSLAAGRALPGPGTVDGYNDLAFALPANASGSYHARKQGAIAQALGDATKIWEAK